MLIAWVVPPFLALTLSIVLRLSARVKSTAAAQQASGLVTLPLIMIAYAQATGSLFGSSRIGLYIGAIAWVVALLCGGVLATGAASAAPAADPCTTATITVTPTSAVQGASVAVDGTCSAATTPVTITLTDSSNTIFTLGSLTSDGDGAITGSVVVPANTAPVLAP